jgi:hypothetical protein
MKESLDSKIKLFIIKCQMSKDIMQMRLNVHMQEVRKKIGEKLFAVDPYGEETWDE